MIGWLLLDVNEKWKKGEERGPRPVLGRTIAITAHRCPHLGGLTAHVRFRHLLV